VKFFTFNLGTLAVILIIAVAGYIAARKVRSRTVTRTIAATDPVAVPAAAAPAT
jgi:hypothetical protein